jgi:hypothetical protein
VLANQGEGKTRLAGMALSSQFRFLKGSVGGRLSLLFFLASPCLKASRLVFCLRAAKLHALYSLDAKGCEPYLRVIAKLIKNPPSGFPARVILSYATACSLRSSDGKQGGGAVAIGSPNLPYPPYRSLANKLWLPHILADDPQAGEADPDPP